MQERPPDILETLLRSGQREEARQRRLAVLATCALPRPLPISALSTALGEDLSVGFELAHGGTLFLDEIADISPRGQAADSDALAAVGQRHPW